METPSIIFDAPPSREHRFLATHDVEYYINLIQQETDKNKPDFILVGQLLCELKDVMHKTTKKKSAFITIVEQRLNRRKSWIYQHMNVFKNYSSSNFPTRYDSFRQASAATSKKRQKRNPFNDDSTPSDPRVQELRSKLVALLQDRQSHQKNGPNNQLELDRINAEVAKIGAQLNMLENFNQKLDKLHAMLDETETITSNLPKNLPADYVQKLHRTITRLDKVITNFKIVIPNASVNQNEETSHVAANRPR